MGIEFNISAGALLTVTGAATFAAILTLWTKHYLSNWRFTPLLVLGITETVTMLAQVIVSLGQMTGEGALAAALMGFVGATLAVFGYETVVNALGLAGVGPRSETQQIQNARALLRR